MDRLTDRHTIGQTERGHTSDFYQWECVLKKITKYHLNGKTGQNTHKTAMKSFKQRIYDCKNMQTILLNCGWAALRTEK